MRLPRLPRRLRSARGTEAPQPQGGMLASAPVPLDWERFADRRPRRLKRGKHFVGEPKFLQREARDAAAEMGKVALISRDQQGKWGYMWVQFVDAEVKEGEPCPVCGARELLKLNNNALRCPSCDSMLEFIPRPLEMPGTGEANADSPGEAAPPSPPARDVSELAEIVSTRTLRADGTVAEAFSTDEALMMETTVRSHQPRLRISVTMAAQVGDQRVFVSRQPGWSELDRPGLYAISVHFPPHFLMGYGYRFKVAMKVDDGSGAEPVTVTREKGTWIAVQTSDGTSRAGEAFVRAALEWTTEPVDTEGVGADLVSIEDGPPM